MHIPVSDQRVRLGLSTVQWPGRLQLLTRSSGNQILLDGAHNLAGARSLSVALEENFSGARPAFILGILQDKDWQGICRLLAPLAIRIYVVPVSSDRTAKPAELRQVCHQANPSAETIVCESVAHALENAVAEPFVVVTGSLYLVGEALEYLEGTCGHRIDERGLNEWSSKA
jgi:dihydrofolate synthase/folylpolyglutamate synthase